MTDWRSFVDTSGEGWRDRALCAQGGPDLFFGFDGESPRLRAVRIRRAKAVCAECPVRSECLDAALSYPGRQYGVWGGLTAREREALPTPRPAIKHGTHLGHRQHVSRGEEPCQACGWAYTDVNGRKSAGGAS